MSIDWPAGSVARRAAHRRIVRMLKPSRRLFVLPLLDRRAPLFMSPLAIVWLDEDMKFDDLVVVDSFTQWLGIEEVPGLNRPGKRIRN